MIGPDDIKIIDKMLSNLRAVKGSDFISLPTAIYARKSSEDDKDTSLATQISLCKEELSKFPQLKLIDEQGGVFKEDDKSGMFDFNRGEFLKLKEKVLNKEVLVIMVYSFDRLSRKIQDFEVLRTLIEENGGVLLSFSEYYPRNASGFHSMRSMLNTAQFHAENTAELVMKTNTESNAINCISSGGIANYGYKFTSTRHMIINENEAPAVRLMFKMFLEGHSYKEIIDALELKGFKTRSNTKFSQTTILSILKNEKYKGTYTYNLKKNKRRRNRVLVREFDEVKIKNGIPAIISETDFQLVQNRLERNRNSSNKTKNYNSDYALTGIIFCKHCGAQYHGCTNIGGSSKKKYSKYVCNNVDNHKDEGKCSAKAIRKEYIEGFVALTLEQIINNIIQLPSFNNSVVKKPKSELEREISSYKGKINRIQKGKIQLIHSMSKLSDDSSKLFKQMEDQYNELDELEVKVQKTLCEALDKLKALSSNTFQTKDNVISLSKEEIMKNPKLLRQLAFTFIQKIHVDNDKVIIEFNNL